MRAARSHNRRAGHLHLGHETTDPTLIRAKRKRKKKGGRRRRAAGSLSSYTIASTGNLRSQISRFNLRVPRE